ncbi:MAG: aspartate--tRNA ligase [bacterium]|nr:aspartate--tRNA ligase [bacterium]
MAKSSFLKRTHTCGELRKDNSGSEVILNGWVDSWRDHGGVRFIDLRDRYGKTQIVFDLEKGKGTHAFAKDMKREFVLAVRGVVGERPDGMVNKNMPTGEIEVITEEIVVLNESKTTPFVISDELDVSEDLRMKWRYLDLRRNFMQKNLMLRHKISQTIRKYFDSQDFIDIETPMLMKSTPEGARDYLVPSRVFPGNFYALPQSPQTYKQILMVSGFDKYFQIVKCFRDEDLRADRQPEFTQLDMEMSFVDEEDIHREIEGCFKALYKDILGRELELPLPSMTYAEAMNTYGTDKPDLRWDLPIVDLSDIVKNSQFKVFGDTVSGGGTVRGLTVKGKADISRKVIDQLTDYAKDAGAKGLVVLKVSENGLEGGISKFLGEDEKAAILKTLRAEAGDLLLIVADSVKRTLNVLGNLRLEVIRKFEFPPKEDYNLLWVTEFPLVEEDEETGKITFTHHPFTSPMHEDVDSLFTDPVNVRSRAYDLVMNGYELGSGSIRIHQRDLQEKIFDVLKLSREEAQEKFGFLLNAFEYGAPPHGGIALGLDRIAMIFANEDSIREVVAFPKTLRAFCPMVETPSKVNPEQLKELGISVAKTKDENE